MVVIMKISCCIPGGSFMPQGEKEIPMAPLTRLTEGCRAIAALGYDCAEATVGMITSLSDEDVAFLQNEHAAGRFDLAACNSFIPGHLPIVTDDNGTEALYAFVDGAIARMASLGVRYVVFGSGRVRTIPEGCDRAKAEKQIEAFISHCNDVCGKHGMILVIEPLNRAETNWCNKVSEGAEIVRRLNLDNVRLLADGYHMAREEEPLSVIAENRDILLHCHVASSDRRIPGKTEYEGAFLDALKAIGYDGIVTVECGFGDFQKEAAEAAEYLRKKLAE